jgi:hypothetical protein
VVVVAVDSGVSLGRALFSTVEVDLWRRWRWAATAAAAADDGGVFFLKPQRCVLLNKYSGGDGREEVTRGQIVGRVERERCVEGRRLRAMGGGGGGRR